MSNAILLKKYKFSNEDTNLSTCICKNHSQTYFLWWENIKQFWCKVSKTTILFWIVLICIQSYSTKSLFLYLVLYTFQWKMATTIINVRERCGWPSAGGCFHWYKGDVCSIRIPSRTRNGTASSTYLSFINI